MSDYPPLELAKAFIQTGELEDALQALNRHLENHPDDDEVRQLRAETLLRMRDEPQMTGKRLQQALNDLAVIKNPPPERLFDLVMQKATLYERLDQPEKAREILRDALERLSTSQAERGQVERLSERLVLMLVSAQRYEEAKTIIQKMPRLWRWLQWSGDIAVKMQNYPQAIEDYTTALALFAEHAETMSEQWVSGIKARLLLARGDASQRVGDLNHAAMDYDLAMTLVSDDPVVKFKRGLLYIIKEELSTGLAFCVEAYQSVKPALREIMESDLKQNSYLSPAQLNMVQSAIKQPDEGK